MTIKVFWKDPYLTELETTVKDVCGNQITLTETIFYAFSGGQESDCGTIGGYQVIKAEKVGLEIYYTILDGHKLNKNDLVKVVIDWDRRYKLMRLHFAAEIVLEFVYKKFPEIKKIGAHISQDKARIDFEFDDSIASVLSDIESSAQALIDSNKPIISAFSDEKTKEDIGRLMNFHKFLAVARTSKLPGKWVL